MSEEMQQDGTFEQTQSHEDNSNGMSEEQQIEQNSQMPVDGQGQEGEGNEENEDVDDDTEDDRKIFIGGLSWESTAKNVREYCETFGKVLNCTLKTDYSTNKSRGFAFVCFASPESVEKVLNKKEPHELHGRKIDPKKATPRPKKIFCGRLNQDISEEDVKEYFSKFGEIETAEFPSDKNNDNKRRSFCFVEFKKMSAFKKCLERTDHKIKSQEVDVKKATLPQQGNAGGMRGGRGRGGFGPGARGGRGGGYQGGYGYPVNNYPYANYYDPNAGYYPEHSGYGYDGSYYGNYYQGGWNGGYPGYNYNYSNQSNFGKTKRGGGQGFHPYNR